MVITTTRGMFTTANGGKTWRKSAAPQVFNMVPDPRQRGRWFASWGGQVHVSTDAARTWRRFAPLPARGAGCCTLDAEPHRLWAVSSGGFFTAGVVAVYSRPLAPSHRR